jgi:hypothetical protein
MLSRGAGVALTTFEYYPTDRPWIIAHNLAGGAANDLALGFSYNLAGGISQASRQFRGHNTQFPGAPKASRTRAVRQPLDCRDSSFFAKKVAVPWFHVHFEVRVGRSLATAAGATRSIRTMSAGEWRPMIRSLLLVPISVTMGCPIQAPADLLLRVDREFAGPALQSVRPPLPGRLVADGEGGCAERPYSACEYSDGAGRHFYFNEGRLVVKRHLFAEAAAGTAGPFGVSRSDRPEAARRKLGAVTGRPDDCGPVGAERVCHTLLGPNTRIDLRFGADGMVRLVQLSITDFL